MTFEASKSQGPGQVLPQTPGSYNTASTYIKKHTYEVQQNIRMNVIYGEKKFNHENLERFRELDILRYMKIQQTYVLRLHDS